MVRVCRAAASGFEVVDGFADDDGEPNRDMPSMRMEFVFEETADGSRFTTAPTSLASTDSSS